MSLPTAPPRRPSPACRRWTRSPIRSAWSRTWSSSSTRADRPERLGKSKGGSSGSRPFSSQLQGLTEEGVGPTQHVGTRRAVLKIMVEIRIDDEFRWAAGVLQPIGHDPRLPDADVHVAVAVKEQHRRDELSGILRRRAL